MVFNRLTTNKFTQPVNPDKIHGFLASPFMKLSISTLPYLKDTSALLSNLQTLGGLCALESATYSNKESQWSILTAQPYRIEEGYLDQSMQAKVEELLNTLPLTDHSDLPFLGGVIGHATYGSNQTGSGVSRVTSSLYTWAYLINHESKVGYLVYWSDISLTSLQCLISLYSESTPPYSSFTLTESFKPLWSRETYKSKIDKIHQYIISGDVYQINLTQKFTAPYSGSSLNAYGKLKAQSHSPFLTYFDLANTSIASASPELFVKVAGNKVFTKPIKGTASRSNNNNIDQDNIEWLKKSQKDRAENLMITDLLRNDLGINCINIKVPKLFDIESFETVHHMVSTITADKDNETSPFKIFSDAFPGGSITGAPKKRAMEIIDELEIDSRGYYCGSTFYYSANRNFSSNILIRSFIFNEEEVECWAGGGITIDSTWESEYQESLDKISRLMQALEN